MRLRLEVERPAACPSGATSALSAADFPTGTLSCGRFGSVSSSASRRCSTARQLRFHARGCCAALRLVLRKNSARIARPPSWPAPPASPAAFCSRLRFSTSGISRRRSASRRGQLRQIGRRIQAARAQPRVDVRRTFPHQQWIDQATCPLPPERAPAPVCRPASYRWPWLRLPAAGVRLRRPSPACRSFQTRILKPLEAGLAFSLRVVRDVPATALEVKGGRRNQLLQRSLAADGTLLERRIRELSNHLEPGTAGVALVFVERHGR